MFKDKLLLIYNILFFNNIAPSLAYQLCHIIYSIIIIIKLITAPCLAERRISS
jgi:hypothetical protein